MIKKIIIICNIFIALLCCSCSNYEVINEVKLEDKNKTKQTKESNPYFCVEEDISIEFQGEIFFDDFGDIPIPKCKTAIYFEKITNLRQGVLYHLTINPISGLNIPEERLSVGYFYVQEDKIIRLWGNDNNIWSLSSEEIEAIVSSDKLPSQSEIVCQENEIKDSLQEDEEGWHQYLVVDGNRREFHSYYKYPQSTGYWESFTWEKGIGLVSYKSGYRDGIDYIELMRMNI